MNNGLDYLIIGVYLMLLMFINVIKIIGFKLELVIIHLK